MARGIPCESAGTLSVKSASKSNALGRSKQYNTDKITKLVGTTLSATLAVLRR